MQPDVSIAIPLLCRYGCEVSYIGSLDRIDLQVILVLLNSS